MIAYKGFNPGLQCLGYQFVMGLNVTEQANCRANGFHCAKNPLDCLSYYSNINHSEYYVVDARGDVDEDGTDTKIACTELYIIKRLTHEEFFLHSLAYMADHPLLKWNSHVNEDRARGMNGVAIVRGKDPIARGEKGDILAFAQENPNNRRIMKVSLAQIDGEKILPHAWYGADLIERRVH